MGLGLGLGSRAWAWAGWAGWPVGEAWNWAGVSSHTLKFETNEDEVRSGTHTSSIYPVLEGLGFRVWEAKETSCVGLGYRLGSLTRISSYIRATGRAERRSSVLSV